MMHVNDDDIKDTHGKTIGHPCIDIVYPQGLEAIKTNARETVDSLQFATRSRQVCNDFSRNFTPSLAIGEDACVRAWCAQRLFV
mmetsp:Transcript_10973/g.21815  ORF Transcript_10973/g.21815 Transcript_10973/m.21815 type:complete len:84 (+) Transcript_10973:1-252(+)